MQLLKHKNNTDVAIQVVKKFYMGKKDTYKVKVRWFNIVNPLNIYYTGIEETLRIPRQDFLKNWMIYE